MCSYCENNPVMGVDPNGEFLDTVFDVVSLGMSIADVVKHPSDPWAWAGLAGDVIDLIPFVCGVGESVKGINAARKTLNAIDGATDSAKIGWKVGDDITSLTKAGNTPSWATVRQRYWKNVAHNSPELYPNIAGYDNLARMKKGLAPKVDDGGVICSMELHHPHGRKGDNFWIFEPVTPSKHAQIDNHRYLRR